MDMESLGGNIQGKKSSQCEETRKEYKHYIPYEKEAVRTVGTVGGIFSFLYPRLNHHCMKCLLWLLKSEESNLHQC